MYEYAKELKHKLLIRWYTNVEKIVHLPKPRRIAIGVFFLVFGFINLFNPFINGLIFLFGGFQILIAKKKDLQETAQKYIKKTGTLLKKYALLILERKKRLSKKIKKKIKEQQIELGTILTKKHDS